METNKIQLQSNNQFLRNLLEDVNTIKDEIVNMTPSDGSPSASLDELFGGTIPFSYTVEAVSGASYGFALNSNGYYESQNKGKGSSYAICRIHLQVNTVSNVTLKCINFAESSFDYGLISNLDKTLTLSSAADSSNVYKNFKGLQSANIVEVTFTNISVGSHTIDVKFIKDGSVNTDNDSIQFNIIDGTAPIPETTIEKILLAEPNLKPENIKEGVNIYGVVGTLTVDGGPKYTQLIKRNITIINNSNVSFIGSYAFYRWSSLTSVSFLLCTSIGNNAFYNCSSLTSVNFPACTSIGTNAFQNCSKLTSVNFPACTSIGTNAFQFCSSLTSVSFPACTRIGNNAFYNCSSLTSVNFPACTSIGTNAFQNCSKLSIITLGASKVCSLYASNAFSSTAITSTTGSIYVPASLVNSYKAAANWSYFSNRIFSK